MFKLGIRSRLILSYLFLLFFALLISGSYILWFFYHYTLDELTENLLSQARVTEQLLQLEPINSTDKNFDQQIKLLGSKISRRITVINTKGKVLADSLNDPASMDDHANRPEVIKALSGQPAKDIRFSSTMKNNWLYSAIPWRINGNTVGVIRVSTSLTGLETGFNKIQSALLAAFFLACVLTVMLSLRLAKNFTAPLEEITKVAQQFSQGVFHQRIHIKTGDEIELLAHTLNNLASSLDDKVDEIVAEKRKLEIILEHMDNAVIVVDRYGRLTTSNKLANDIFSITPQMLSQHNIQVIGNSYLDRAIHQCIDTAKSNLIDLKTNFKNNKRVFQVFVAPIFDTDKEITGSLCVFHDITTLQAIAERQAEFIANASHELATPLTAIKGFAETLLDGALQDPQLSNKFVDIIYNEADRMQRLVTDLLQLAKFDSSEYRQHIKLASTEAVTIIQQVVDELMPHWQRKNQSVTIEGSPQSVTVHANYDWLKQIFVNLIENAIKYTPPEGKVLIKYSCDATQAIFQIIDTGPGIHAKDLPLIFARFYRVDRSRTRAAGGTGLGLAIVKFIVEMLKGSISVKSELNVGTTFTLSLPLANTQNPD